MIPYLAVKNAVGRRKLHGRINFQGLPIAVENAKSSSRAWHNPDNGSNGITHMKVPYGYFTGTLGVDGDAVDVYVGPDRESQKVFVVHQMSAPDFTSYDEDKCMLGFNSEDAARVTYLKQYNDPRFLGPITEMTIDELKEKLETHRGHMLKSHIHAYTRQTADGRRVFVPDHQDSRQASEKPVNAPNGRDSFGMIQGEMAASAHMPPGPIRLFSGAQRGQHQGFGLQHIKEQHGSEIRAAGYASEEEFVADVVKNFTAIYKTGDRYALVTENNGKPKVHILEIRHEKAQAVYSVVTGYIADRSAVKRDWQLLWKRGGLRKAQLEEIKEAFESGKVTKESICRTLREAISAEYEAINLYTRMAEQVGNEVARDTLLSVVDEERKHVGEFLKVLTLVDPEEAELYRQGGEEVGEGGKGVRKALLPFLCRIKPKEEVCPWLD